MPTVLTRRRALRQTAGMGLALAFALAPAVALAAQERIKLFKIITTKDDITIGVTETELRAMGIEPASTTYTIAAPKS